jgi:hypothetical protein
MSAATHHTFDPRRPDIAEDRTVCTRASGASWTMWWCLSHNNRRFGQGCIGLDWYGRELLGHLVAEKRGGCAFRPGVRSTTVCGAQRFPDSEVRLGICGSRSQVKSCGAWG